MRLHFCARNGNQTIRARGLAGYDVALTWRRSWVRISAGPFKNFQEIFRKVKNWRFYLMLLSFGIYLPAQVAQWESAALKRQLSPVRIRVWAPYHISSVAVITGRCQRSNPGSNPGWCIFNIIAKNDSREYRYFWFLRFFRFYSSKHISY